MLKRLYRILLSVALLISSCSFDIIPNRAGEVFIIGVALDYEHMNVGINGTIDDVIELAAAYEAYLDRAGIPYTEKYFLQSGSSPDTEGEEYPSIENVTEYIEFLQCDKDDLVVFIFSGHGDDKLTGVPCLLFGSSPTSSPLPLYPMTDLFELLQSRNCQSLAVIDACYSGGAAINWTNNLLTCVGEMFRRNPAYGVNVMAAARSFEESHFSNGFFDSEESHGIFTYYLLEEMGWHHVDHERRTVESNGVTYTVYGSPSQILPSGTTMNEIYQMVISNEDRIELMDRRNYTEIPIINKGMSNLVMIP